MEDIIKDIFDEEEVTVTTEQQLEQVPSTTESKVQPSTDAIDAAVGFGGSDFILNAVVFNLL